MTRLLGWYSSHYERGTDRGHERVEDGDGEGGSAGEGLGQVQLRVRVVVVVLQFITVRPRDLVHFYVYPMYGNTTPFLHLPLPLQYDHEGLSIFI